MDATKSMIGRLHEIAVRESDNVLAATCLIALGETEGNPTWSLPLGARRRLEAMTQKEAVEQCIFVMATRGDIPGDSEYRIAFAKADGSWDVVETFKAASDDDANRYAEQNYDGQDWYVLDARGRNINGGKN